MPQYKTEKRYTRRRAVTVCIRNTNFTHTINPFRGRFVLILKYPSGYKYVLSKGRNIPIFFVYICKILKCVANLARWLYHLILPFQDAFRMKINSSFNLEPDNGPHSFLGEKCVTENTSSVIGYNDHEKKQETIRRKWKYNK